MNSLSRAYLVFQNSRPPTTSFTPARSHLKALLGPSSRGSRFSAKSRLLRGKPAPKSGKWLCSLSPSDEDDLRDQCIGEGSAASQLFVEPAEQMTFALLTAFAYVWLTHVEPASAASLSEDSYTIGVPHAQELWNVAEGEDFWANMGRYAKYAVTVVFGTGYVIVKPLFKLFSKPQTAIPFALFIYFFYRFIVFTVQSMLGLNDPDTINYQG